MGLFRISVFAYAERIGEASSWFKAHGKQVHIQSWASLDEAEFTH